MANIRLVSAETAHFASYIISNSIDWHRAALEDLRRLADDYEHIGQVLDAASFSNQGLAVSESRSFRDAIERHAQRKYAVTRGEAKGQHLVLCGAGPSLAEHAADYCKTADQVWGCNSALTWLVEHGHAATHGFAIDQTRAMCDEWATVPDVEYLIASSVNPELVALLRASHRPLRYFHNYVGIQQPPVRYFDDCGVRCDMDYETSLYTTRYPSTVMAGSGLNSVTRAVDVARFMGFDTITILGADCCLKVTGQHQHAFAPGSQAHIRWLRTHTQMHANGGNALASGATGVTLTAPIDAGTSDATIRRGKGRWWTTKPDMIVSAQWLLRMARASGGSIRLIGDTLPNALALKDEEYLQRLPNFVDAEGRVTMVPTAEDLQ